MNRVEHDKALVARLIAGDDAAFDEFAEHYIPALHRFASSRLRTSPDLVQDIVQSTLCKALAKLATFRGEAALMTWLCACCRNEIAAHFRLRRRAGVELEFQVVEEVGAEAMQGQRPEAPDGLLLSKETADRVHQALDVLPPHYGKALEWKYIESVSVSEIARRLSLSPKAAESLLTRARTAFKREHDRLVDALSVNYPPVTTRLEAQS